MNKQLFVERDNRLHGPCWPISHQSVRRGVVFGSDRGQGAVRSMSTEPQRTCPSCGNELSGEMEFCPVCMLRKALADGVESGEPSSKDTVTLVPAEVLDNVQNVTGVPPSQATSATESNGQVIINLPHVSGEMVQINTSRLESTLTNPSDCRRKILMNRRAAHVQLAGDLLLRSLITRRQNSLANGVL
jgi:hypothetical protein